MLDQLNPRLTEEIHCFIYSITCNYVGYKMDTAFEIRLGTRQLPRLLPKEICNVRRQIIAEAKFS